MPARPTFERELRDLQDELLVMSSMVDKAISRSVDALKNRDLSLARLVVADDHKVNAKRFEIEEKCILVIATQAPLAGDLRTIVAVLNVITDLERMADHCVGIAKIAIMIGHEPPLKPLIDIPRMADQSREMLRRAMDAFIARDQEAATVVAKEDDIVDQLYDQVYRELLTFMLNDTRTIDRATHLLWVAHNLERVADRVTNICERVNFLVTGRMEEYTAPPKGSTEG
jgi:phosphate transport system protein